MRNLYLLFVTSILLLCLNNLNSQVTTNTGYTPTTLVNTVLLGGGVTASNITYTGYANGYARFDATAGTNLGFASGIYLTTGSVLANDPLGWGGGTDGPLGPSSSLQSISQMAAGDADLNTMLTALNCVAMTTNDAAVLEFDFIPVTDTIQFRYRFGSEEYNDYVGTLCSGSAFEFNDVFAFYLEGVTTFYPKTNIALIPGTGTPVSIYTVNNGNSWADALGPCMNCAYYVDNYFGAVDVVYDGLTTPLTAVATVIPGQTYHIKLAIADAVDNAYDSGVFIEANSFTSFPMPVTLVDFDGNCAQDKVKLNWSTSSEINNSHFEIEQSIDMINWDEIGRVSGEGNSNVHVSYEWTSTEAIDKDAYYRIVQEDFDGTEHFYSPVFIKACTQTMKLNVSISNDQIALLQMNNLPVGEYKIQLMHIGGKVISTQTTSVIDPMQYISLDVRSLAGGCYIVVVEGSQASISTKFMLQGN